MRGRVSSRSKTVAEVAEEEGEEEQGGPLLALLAAFMAGGRGRGGRRLGEDGRRRSCLLALAAAVALLWWWAHALLIGAVPGCGVVCCELDTVKGMMVAWKQRRNAEAITSSLPF